MCSMLILHFFNRYGRENWYDISLIMLKRNHIITDQEFELYSSEICREIPFYLRRYRKLSFRDSRIWICICNARC